MDNTLLICAILFFLNIALKNDSKELEIEISGSIKCFKIIFKTKKSA